MLIRSAYKVRVNGNFKRCVDAGKTPYETCSGALIQALRVPSLTDVEWCVDKDFRHPRYKFSSDLTVLFKGSNQGHKYEVHMGRENFGYMRSPSDLLRTIRVAEAQVTGET